MAENDNQDIQSVLDQAGTIDPNDPDMMAKLNEMALKIAEAQGKINPSNSVNAQIDPMDELGCEGCQ